MPVFMKKVSSTSAIRRRRDHLAEMAARGTTHEQSIAKEKLKRMEEKYDFSAAAEIGDIFAGWIRPSHSHLAHPVLKVKKEWLDPANLIKWVFQDQFKAASSWRSTPAGAELMLHASKGDVKRLQPFARDLHDTIVAACAEFSRGRTIRELDRAPFLTGLYDGLIDEPRPHGSVMPGFSPVAKKKPGRARKSPKNQPHAATTVHPYDLGRDAGKKLRVAIPRDELCEGIRLAVTGPEED